MLRSRQALWEELKCLAWKWRGAAAVNHDAPGMSGYSAGLERAAKELLDTLGEASGGISGIAWAASSYPPETVFTRSELAAALQCSYRTIERSALPASYALGGKSPRYIWRQVIEHLEKSAELSFR